MVTKTTNPFVLPGLGQMGDLAQNPLLASMEMMRKAWEGMASTGSFDQAIANAGVSPQDLERRLADLRAVEHWLRMNLSMLGSTIQALEVQRATISTLKAFVTSGAGLDTSGKGFVPVQPAAPSGDSSGLFGSPPDMTKPAADPAQAAQQAASETSTPNPAEAAMQTWWDMLQTQFDNLADATAATLQSAEAVQDAAVAAQQQAVSATVRAATGAAPVKTTAAKKTAAKKAAARKTVAKAAKTGAARKVAAKKTAAKKRVSKTTTAAKSSTTK